MIGSATVAGFAVSLAGVASNSVDQAQSTRMYVEEKAQILENYLGGR